MDQFYRSIFFICILFFLGFRLRLIKIFFGSLQYFRWLLEMFVIKGCAKNGAYVVRITLVAKKFIQAVLQSGQNDIQVFRFFQFFVEGSKSPACEFGNGIHRAQVAP